MTKVQILMKENHLTVYRLLTIMGKNPINDATNWKKKIKGERTVTMEEVTAVSVALSEWAKKPILPQELHTEISSLRFI